MHETRTERTYGGIGVSLLMIGVLLATWKALLAIMVIAGGLVILRWIHQYRGEALPSNLPGTLLPAAGDDPGH